jgi:hypothetical protein
MKRLDLKNSLHLHIKSHQKIRNCQRSDFFTKIALAAFIILFLQACATPELYHANLKYEPTGTFPEMKKAGSNSLITVAMFNDIRQIDDRLQLGRVTTMGGTVIPVFPQYMKIPDAVTTSIREYLFKSGYRISNDVPIWDLREETINKGRGKILIGGNIDELEILCDDSFPVKTYRTKLKLTFVFADVAHKRIFYRSSIENSASLQDISFSEEILNKQISAVLSGALEKMFNDPVMRKRIEDALKMKNNH